MSEDYPPLSRLQVEINEWARRNFGPHEPPFHRCLLGAMEELGELARAHLKAEQGIRGSVAEHEAAAQDALADCIIFLVDYCNAREWDLQSVLWLTWDKVCRRDWQADPLSGRKP